MYGSQCCMIEFGGIKIAIGKRTLNKSHPNKITSGKITIDKLTGFKFFELHFLFTISGVLVGQIKEVCCHNLSEKVINWIVCPTKLRFENTIKTKKRSNCFWIAYPVKLRFEKTKNPKIISSKLDHFWIVLVLFVTSTGFKPVTF